MGDRYYFSCPVCGDMNYFGNWTNYVEKCRCGQWLTVTYGVSVVTEELAKELMKNE